MAHVNPSSSGWAYNEKRKLLRELVILSSVFAGLAVLAVRPFGFRTFLNALGHDNIFSLLLIVAAVAVILIMLQRLGLIFPDQVETGKDEYA